MPFWFELLGVRFFYNVSLSAFLLQFTTKRVMLVAALVAAAAAAPHAQHQSRTCHAWSQSLLSTAKCQRNKTAVLRSTGSAARHRLPSQAAHPQRSVSRTMRLVTSYKDHAGESTTTQAAVSRRHSAAAWTLSNTILAVFTSGACTVTGHSTEQRLCSNALHCSNDRHTPGHNNKAGDGHEQQHQRSWLAEAATCCG